MPVPVSHVLMPLISSNALTDGRSEHGGFGASGPGRGSEGPAARTGGAQPAVDERRSARAASGRHESAAAVAACRAEEAGRRHPCAERRQGADAFGRPAARGARRAMTKVVVDASVAAKWLAP